MDNTIIEKKGVSSVTDYLCNVGCIDPHLHYDDTIAMWDGDLFVYKTRENFSKSNYSFRIPVQIKSEDIKDSQFPEHTSFSIPVVDLCHYLTDGGLVFFKVLINSQKETRVYCAFLTKNAIEDIYKDAIGQKTKSISLDKAPTDYNVLLENLKRINLQAKHPLIDWNYLTQCDNPHFKIQIDNLSKGTDMFEYMATHNVDVLVSFNNLPCDFYTKGGPATLHLIQTIKCNVIIEGRTFYNLYKTSYEQDGYHYYFGDSLQLIVPYKDDEHTKPSCNIKINANTIENIILDFDFIVSLFKYKKIIIGANQIDLEGFNVSDDKIKEYSQYFQFWKDVNTLFTILHIECSLNPDSFSDNDEHLLRILIQSLVYNKPVFGEEGEDKIHLFQIAGMDIYVFAKHIEGRKYQLQDIYERFCATYKDENNMIQPLPLQSLFWELEKLPANLVFNNLIEQYKKYKEKNPKIAIQANQDLLNMLKHYDRCHDKRLLDAAIELALWLRNEGVNENLSFLNYIQTKLRKDKELNDDDRKQLYLLQASNDTEDFARYLLLGNKEKAMTFWEKIPENDRIFLKTLPIYYFMNEKKDKL